MTLDEAIKHCEEVAAEQCDNGCGKDHAQLAEWLKELKRLKEAKVAEVWVARDRGGIMRFFINEPTDDEDYDCFLPTGFGTTSKTWLPEVTFENSPQKVELRLIGK